MIREQMIELLRDKCDLCNRRCPTCDSGDWTVENRIYRLSELGTTPLVGGHAVPLIPVTCCNCGHTVLFNAIVLGVRS